jgi:hypothetical protein
LKEVAIPFLDWDWVEPLPEKFKLVPSTPIFDSRIKPGRQSSNARAGVAEKRIPANDTDFRAFIVFPVLRVY